MEAGGAGPAVAAGSGARGGGDGPAAADGVAGDALLLNLAMLRQTHFVRRPVGAGGRLHGSLCQEVFQRFAGVLLAPIVMRPPLAAS